jgi:hypothetical protein
MLKFKIHFSIPDYDDDYFFINGWTIEECISNTKNEAERRGLDFEKNHMWSEEV